MKEPARINAKAKGTTSQINRLRRQGVNGERQVRLILSQLSKNHFVILHDIKAMYGNIDHLVISREGAVFLLETKAHKGRITVREDKLLLNGKPPRKNFIGQINRNIRWLREKIVSKLGVNPWIVAVLVFTNSHVARKQVVKRVNIVGKNSLSSLIERYSPRTPRKAIWNRRDDLARSLTDL